MMHILRFKGFFFQKINVQLLELKIKENGGRTINLINSGCFDPLPFESTSEF